MEQGSEVARSMRQIDLELEAAERTLHGFAITARHDFINARMQRGGERILRLIEEGRHEEAQVLMNTDNWGIKEEKKTKKRRQTGKKGMEEDNRRIKKGETKAGA